MMDVTADRFACSTERLRLRPLRTEDESLYCRLYCDPEIMSLVDKPMSREQAICSFLRTLEQQQAQPMRWLLMAIEERSTNQAIGLVGVPNFDPTAERLEMGLMLERMAHGKSYPREILVAFVRSLFSILPVEEIWVQYPSENRAADRAVRNIGFALDTEAVRGEGTCIRSAGRRAWHQRYDEKTS